MAVGDPSCLCRERRERRFILREPSIRAWRSAECLGVTPAGLPRGRYLQSLQALSLAGNAMERLPAALATAAKLETLDMSEMELQLGRAGKKLLFEMPALKLVRAFAAPHVDAGAPLRLADELYRVNKMRQQQVRLPRFEARTPRPGACAPGS